MPLRWLRMYEKQCGTEFLFTIRASLMKITCRSGVANAFVDRDSSTHNLPAAAYLGVDQGHFRDTAASCVFVFLCEYACVGISFLCLSRHSRATSAADNEQLSVMAHDVDSFMPRPVI